MRIFPSELLSYVYGENSLIRNRIGTPVPHFSLKFMGGSGPMVNVHHHSPFNCCGAGVIAGLDSVFTSVEHKQEFLARWILSKPIELTYYFLPTGRQLSYALENSNSLLNLLIVELGAQKIDESPNRLHDPNMMCMHKLCLLPSVNPNVLKYVSFTNPKLISNTWNKPIPITNSVVPLWWTQLSETEQTKYLESKAAELEKIRKKTLQYAEDAEANRKAQERFNLINRISYHPNKFAEEIKAALTACSVQHQNMFKEVLNGTASTDVPKDVPQQHANPVEWGEIDQGVWKGI